MPNSGSKPRLVFFGNERIATGVTTEAPVLRMLIAQGYDICAVVVHNTVTRSRNARTLEVASIAQEHGIPLISPDKPGEIIDQIRSYGATAGILIAYGKIIPESFIDIFPFGIINIHPSLLPKHRGPTPIESSILAGDAETGISVMKISRQMDAGPVWAQATLPLSGTETKQALADTLGSLAADVLRDRLPGILDGSIPALPQNDSEATYDQLIDKQSGILDTNKPAIALEREIRAFAMWPGSRISLDGFDITVTQATALDNTPANATSSPLFVADKQLYLRASDGTLRVTMLKPAGKSEMTAQAFLAGYTHKL